MAVCRLPAVGATWQKTEGRDEVAVHVADVRDAQFFEVPAKPAHARSRRRVRGFGVSSPGRGEPWDVRM